MKNIENYIHNFNNVLTPDRRISSFVVRIEGFNSNLLVNHLLTTNHKFFYTSKPINDLTFLGVGSVFDLEILGNNRVTDTSNSLLKLQGNVYNNFKEFGLETIPLFLGGMKFSPEEVSNIWTDYYDSDWFIPEFLFIKKSDEYFVILNHHTNNLSEEIFQDSFEAAEQLISHLNKSSQLSSNLVISSNIYDPAEKFRWINQVNSALKQIAEGEVQKIVLSRQVQLELKASPNFELILSELNNLYPRCYIFVYKKNDSIFFGASPETLARISNGWVEADALAGSIPRGFDSVEDEKFANELLNSTKNLSEQKAVVEFITNSFAQFSEEIIYDPNPKIRKLLNIQHLWTSIRAKLNTNQTIFSILKNIHPTPAICGVPWTNALVSIRKMENHSRGMFAGMVGWFNFENEGEFAVAIRSALIKDNIIYAFAGCGIVDGSDPEQEFEESELKLKPILSLFKNEEVYQS